MRYDSRASRPAGAREYHQEFAARITHRIQEGTAPWQQRWKPGERFLPHNLSSGRNYTAGNSIYLADAAERRGFADNRWATYRQIKALGGHVRPGEHGEQIVFFQRSQRVLERDDQGKPRTDAEGNRVYRHDPLDKPVWRTYTVFNAEQTGGLKLARAAPRPGPDWEAHLKADAVLLENRAPIEHADRDVAYYSLDKDRIVLPVPWKFPTPDDYYATALHELAHATGHPDRLNRSILHVAEASGSFSSDDWGREELRAEISAMLTGDRLAVGHTPQHPDAYRPHWTAIIQANPRELYRAAADAQRMTNYVLEAARQRLQGIDKQIADSARDQQMPRDRGPDRDRPARAPDRAPALEHSR